MMFVGENATVSGNPLDFATLQFFVDAGDTSTITDAGSGATSQWRDLSPNANHLNQGTGANRPTTGTTTQNGLNTIDFDGSNDWMDGTGYSIDVSTRAITVFAVLKFDATGTGKCAFYFDRSGQAVSLNSLQFEYNGALASIICYGDGRSSFDAGAYRERAYTFPGTTNYNRYVFTIDPTNGIVLSVNGTSTTLTDVGGGGAGPADFLSLNSTAWIPHVGRRPDPFYFDGKIATLGVIKGVLNSTELAALNAWLFARWGV